MRASPRTCCATTAASVAAGRIARDDDAVGVDAELVRLAPPASGTPPRHRRARPGTCARARGGSRPRRRRSRCGRRRSGRAGRRPRGCRSPSRRRGSRGWSAAGAPPSRPADRCAPAAGRPGRRWCGRRSRRPAPGWPDISGWKRSNSARACGDAQHVHRLLAAARQQLQEPLGAGVERAAVDRDRRAGQDIDPGDRHAQGQVGRLALQLARDLLQLHRRFPSMSSTRGHPLASLAGDGR